MTSANDYWKEVYKRVFKRTVRYSSRLEIREELAQSVFLEWCEYENRNGKRSSQTIDQAIVDALRRINDRKGTARYKFVIAMDAQGKSVEEMRERGIEFTSPDALCHGLPREDGGDLALHRETLDLREQAVVNMTASGLAQDQIAEIFGVTPARISQILKSAKTNMRNSVIFRQRHEFIEEGRTLLEVRWITL